MYQRGWSPARTPHTHFRLHIPRFSPLVLPSSHRPNSETDSLSIPIPIDAAFRLSPLSSGRERRAGSGGRGGGV